MKSFVLLESYHMSTEFFVLDGCESLVCHLNCSNYTIVCRNFLHSFIVGVELETS